MCTFGYAYVRVRVYVSVMTSLRCLITLSPTGSELMPTRSQPCFLTVADSEKSTKDEERVKGDTRNITLAYVINFRTRMNDRKNGIIGKSGNVLPHDGI